MRALLMIYSICCYLAGVAALVFLILFMADWWVPVTVNSGSAYAPQLSPLLAMGWNTLLVLLWGLQHSVMADPAFKKFWVRIVPPAVERSTYVLTVAIVTFAIILLWCPIPHMLWQTSGSVLGYTLSGVYVFGWVVVLVSTFLINHWHLFGLQQAYQQVRNLPSKESSFVTPLLYKLVRHPMMTGVLISLWAVADMSWGRLLFAVLMTVYVYLGTRHEEKTLTAELGEKYQEYCKTTPMLVPGVPKIRRVN
ncbi:isoprenylcysteine carboxylmethyltransferase family protein [Porticoccus sp. W117]|uniref:methyltransferase family protein n=1 Tax=Porticoccus sp. W117 TaxID=3054777 RepID=UPI002593B05B|nr:isoprenylcysteine carboxylmethyltransferase family protein [Porticoccus sp. W117]MDM3870993.1 isoprenylcysteine carboxylmethyltransferase family protein [Porticoccus sp. W117]